MSALLKLGDFREMPRDICSPDATLGSINQFTLPPAGTL